MPGRTRTAAPASGHYNDHRRSSVRARILARVRAAQHRHSPAHRFGARDDGGRQRPSDARAAPPPTSRRPCSSRRCATTRASRRTPTTIASCCRRDTRRRCSTRHGPRPASSARDDLLTLQTLRLRSRGTSDAAAAVGGRRDRIARSGTLRRRRHRAERAADRLRLSHLRAARRRRDRRRLGLGSGARRGPRQARFAVRDHRRQRTRAESADAVGPRHRRLRRAVARVRLARHRHRRPRHGRDPRRPSTRPGPRRAGRR